MSRHIRRRVTLALRIVILVTIGSGMLNASAVAAGGTGDEGRLDLAALMLHSDDLDNWLFEQMEVPEVEPENDWVGYGMLLSNSHTSIEDAMASGDYAIGRGVFDLSRMGEETAADLLEEAGWVRSQSQWLGLPDPRVEDGWSIAVAVTIEEYATVDGAKAGLRAFDDARTLAVTGLTTEVRRLEPPPAFDNMNAAMWETDTTWYAIDGMTEIVTMWVQVDTLVVSVALIHAPGYKAPDPDLLVPLMELQLKRLEHAEHLYQPGLSTCAPELGGDQVTDMRFDYQVLNGQVFPWYNETFGELAEAQQKFDELGIVDMVHVSQQVESAAGAMDGTFWFRGRTQTHIDEEHAAAFIDWVEGDLAEQYTDVQAIEDVPGLGDATAALTYTGSEGNITTIVYVQIGLDVFSVRLGSTTEPVPDAVYELAELQVERLESGDCADPLPVPRGL